MSLNLNHVVLAGNLTRDPELRQVTPERAVANFGIAVNRRWRNPAGEPTEEVTFLDIEAWGRTGELVGQYLRKGSPAYIEGRLKLDSWEDKEGQKRQRIKVVAETVQFLGRRPERSGDGEESNQDAGATAAPAPAAASANPGRTPAPRPPAPAKATVGTGEPPF